MRSRSPARNAALLGPSVNHVVSKQSPTAVYSAAPTERRYCATFFFTGIYLFIAETERRREPPGERELRRVEMPGSCSRRTRVGGNEPVFRRPSSRSELPRKAVRNLRTDRGPPIVPSGPLFCRS